jgi:hypothetical protein
MVDAGGWTDAAAKRYIIGTFFISCLLVILLVLVGAWFVLKVRRNTLHNPCLPSLFALLFDAIPHAVVPSFCPCLDRCELNRLFSPYPLCLLFFFVSKFGKHHSPKVNKGTLAKLVDDTQTRDTRPSGTPTNLAKGNRAFYSSSNESDHSDTPSVSRSESVVTGIRHRRALKQNGYVTVACAIGTIYPPFLLVTDSLLLSSLLTS